MIDANLEMFHVQSVEMPGSSGGDEERSNSGVDDGEVGGDTVRQADLAQVGEVLHDVSGAVRAGGGEQRGEDDEETGPGGDIGVEEVVDMNPSTRGQGQVHQEDEDDDDEGDERLELYQAGSDV